MNPILKKKLIKKLNADPNNPQIHSLQDGIDIGWGQMFDGLIAILSRGHYIGSNSADRIGEVITKNIRLRREKRGESK